MMKNTGRVLPFRCINLGDTSCYARFRSITNAPRVSREMPVKMLTGSHVLEEAERVVKVMAVGSELELLK